MSGGSYDYAYRHVQDMADAMRSRHASDPLALAFAAHLDLVATAMRAVEWADSHDTAWADAFEPMRATLHPDAELEQARALAVRLRDALTDALEAPHA
jgi:hypothetical protein